jgi:hypothetical protein
MISGFLSRTQKGPLHCLSVHELKDAHAGVHGARSAGIVAGDGAQAHRNLKPSNVIQLSGSQNGNITVTDFGRAARIGTAPTCCVFCVVFEEKMHRCV